MLHHGSLLYFPLHLINMIDLQVLMSDWICKYYTLSFAYERLPSKILLRENIFNTGTTLDSLTVLIDRRRFSLWLYIC